MTVKSEKRINIKFPNKQQGDFVRELRSTVKNYFTENNISQYANGRMIVKTIIMFSIFLVPYLLMMTGIVSHPLLMLMLWIMMGFGIAGIGFSIMHDANHRSYSKNPVVNRVLSWSLYLLGGFPPTWQYQHNTLHHGYTNIEGHDEDIDAGKILRFSPSQPKLKIHRYQHIYAWFLYGLMTLTWTINKDFKQLFRYWREEEKFRKKNSLNFLVTKLILTKIFYYSYILVLPMIILPVPWYVVLIYYFTMHFVSGLFLGMVFQTAHVMPGSQYPEPDKSGSMENNWAIHQLVTTTDYSPDAKFFSWFIGGLNFQVEHHLFPNICHVHYSKIRHIVEETAGKYDIPYHIQPDFPTAVAAHYRMLKFFGRQPASRSGMNYATFRGISAGSKRPSV